MTLTPNRSPSWRAAWSPTTTQKRYLGENVAVGAAAPAGRAGRLREGPAQRNQPVLRLRPDRDGAPAVSGGDGIAAVGRRLPLRQVRAAALSGRSAHRNP